MLLNNPDFGMPAFAATLVALLVDAPRAVARARSAGSRWRPRSDCSAALALVALLTLAAAGSLPHLVLPLHVPETVGRRRRDDAADADARLPPRALRDVRGRARARDRARVRGAEQRALTAMLAWSAVFGLGASSYFAGRSHPEVLISLFSAWMLVAGAAGDRRGARARGARRPPADASPRLARAVRLRARGLLARADADAVVADRPHRRHAGPPNSPIQRFDARRFVAAPARTPGERVLILIPMGHRIAYELGLVNVAPYVSMISMPAVEQLDEALAMLRSEGGRRVFAYLGQVTPEQQQAIQEAGFARVRGTDDYAEYHAGTGEAACSHQLVRDARRDHVEAEQQRRAAQPRVARDRRERQQPTRRTTARARRCSRSSASVAQPAAVEPVDPAAPRRPQQRSHGGAANASANSSRRPAGSPSKPSIEATRFGTL